jgi:hemerythrin-like domain-containing protein
MVEHRLIERMIALMRTSLARIQATHAVAPEFVATVIDFIRTYADQTHHGKEEDILFRKLSGRPLSAEHKRILNDLIEEHVVARKTVKALAEANALYRGGEPAAWAQVADNLRTLAEFYPVHIEKEDNVFFPAARSYFSEEEDQAMLDEFREFDRKMIHEKYKSLVAELERG